ncbi:hypothetical protein PROFUN_00482 [Planoprotostelium fungivorum]|uniref:Uncharacterized protein n=1 Tax=Planoprotostelium fungivorum TaxID=1890364 RepID=A0A2P6N0Z6_9EUKA|nr:hypothetical protein PROFUN_00482 [Planoprotostelium fungivorum]
MPLIRPPLLHTKHAHAKYKSSFQSSSLIGSIQMLAATQVNFKSEDDSGDKTEDEETTTYAREDGIAQRDERPSQDSSSRCQPQNWALKRDASSSVISDTNLVRREGQAMERSV